MVIETPQIQGLRQLFTELDRLRQLPVLLEYPCAQCGYSPQGCSDACSDLGKIIRTIKAIIVQSDLAAKDIRSAWNLYRVESDVEQYETTFLRNLLGITSKQAVKTDLATLQTKFCDFFNSIDKSVFYSLLEFYTVYFAYFEFASRYVPEANFSSLEILLSRIIQSSVCVTHMDLVMTKNSRFNLKLKWLAPPPCVEMSAQFCPFVLSSSDADECGFADFQVVNSQAQRTFEDNLRKYAIVDELINTTSLVTTSDEGTSGRAKRKAASVASNCLHRNRQAFSPTDETHCIMIIESRKSSPKLLSKVLRRARQSAEPKQGICEKLYNILLCVEISVWQKKLTLYKRIRIPVGVITNTNQSCESYGSIFWSLILMNEEKCGVHQWKQTAGNQWCFELKYFTSYYLQPLWNALVRLKEQKKEDSEDQTDINGNEMGLSQPCLNGSHVTFLGETLNKTAKRLDQPDWVTRQLFLGELKFCEKSYFCWYYHTCQAIGKNFGLKPVVPSWFGDPARSVWHSGFVVGYISEENAVALLQRLAKQKPLLLIRFSASKKQSIVIHVMQAKHGMVQRKPVEMANGAGSIEIVVKDAIDGGIYDVVTVDGEGNFVIKTKTEFEEWIRKSKLMPVPATENVQPTDAAGPRSTERYVSSTNRQLRSIQTDAQLGELLNKIAVESNNVKKLYELLQKWKTSETLTDFEEHFAPGKALLNSEPTLTHLLKCLGEQSLTPDNTSVVNSDAQAEESN